MRAFFPLLFERTSRDGPEQMAFARSLHSVRVAVARRAGRISCCTKKDLAYRLAKSAYRL
jgi:hypothetical protein